MHSLMEQIQLVVCNAYKQQNFQYLNFYYFSVSLQQQFQKNGGKKRVPKETLQKKRVPKETLQKKRMPKETLQKKRVPKETLKKKRVSKETLKKKIQIKK